MGCRKARRYLAWWVGTRVQGAVVEVDNEKMAVQEGKHEEDEEGEASGVHPQDLWHPRVDSEESKF